MKKIEQTKFGEDANLLDTDCYEESDGSYDEDIKFWMPLPEPPKEQE